MNDAKRTVKQKAFEGMMEYLFISFYLGVVLSLFTVYKVVILAEHTSTSRRTDSLSSTHWRWQRSSWLHRNCILPSSFAMRR